jgi:hypothetical protein
MFHNQGFGRGRPRPEAQGSSGFRISFQGLRHDREFSNRDGRAGYAPRTRGASIQGPTGRGLGVTEPTTSHLLAGHTLVGCWLLTDRGRQNVHLAAVLGDGAAGDADPVIEETVTDLGVAEGSPRCALIADDLLDHVLDTE